jgi:hypothetical protein
LFIVGKIATSVPELLALGRFRPPTLERCSLVPELLYSGHFHPQSDLTVHVSMPHHSNVYRGFCTQVKRLSYYRRLHFSLLHGLGGIDLCLSLPHEPHRRLPRFRLAAQPPPRLPIASPRRGSSEAPMLTAAEP